MEIQDARRDVSKNDALRFFLFFLLQIDNLGVN